MLTIERTQVDQDENGDLWEHHGPENNARCFVFCEAHKPEMERLLKLALNGGAG
jgi:hypothetical protein